tara:strand:+ start:524 stop:757 length:234 start_codon:yes stop_codon:yes gene_type:complete
MKFRYVSNIPTLLVVEGKFTTVSAGDVVDVPAAPSGDFVRVEPIKQKPVVKKTVPAAKKSTPKVTKYGDQTETSGLG